VRTSCEGWVEPTQIGKWPTVRLEEEDAGPRPCSDCGRPAQAFILAGPVFLCYDDLNRRRAEIARATKAIRDE
jgi:hypothetical protein